MVFYQASERTEQLPTNLKSSRFFKDFENAIETLLPLQSNDNFMFSICLSVNSDYCQTARLPDHRDGLKLRSTDGMHVLVLSFVGDKTEKT